MPGISRSGGKKTEVQGKKGEALRYEGQKFCKGDLQ